ncbi:uncharacterized protein LOC113506506 [Trichoplusia ni]|uniref:Uncharacterized protein LOC113506506 n=1 Tax=Trichoplusia ni TaxID=7111 RepID=A0A7E5WWC7_TRINI|nr:uncharacterized protein LOC113506506 [Trichoplusia ni]
MQCFNALRSSVFRASFEPAQLQLIHILKRFRRCSPCDTCFFPPEKKPCFDIRNVTIERATTCHSRMIRSFLYTQYWPREPSVVGLWMPINSPYLEVLTDKYSNSGERILAFEKIQRTGERRLIGVTVANRVYPWMVDELEEWAHYTASKPEKHRMYFCAHCLRSPNLFKKYNVDYIYDIEVLGTAAEVTGQGVGTLLLKNALASAEEMRHPLVQLVSCSQYTSKICEKCGMKRVWTMDYSDFVDDAGQRVFFPRRPHHTVGLYVKYFDPKIGGIEPCKPPY